MKNIFSNTVIAAIVVAAMGVATFSGCSKDSKTTGPVTPKEDDRNAIEQQYFGVDNGTYNDGAFPEATATGATPNDWQSASSNNSANIGNSGAVSGGSTDATTITITSEKPMVEFYIGVAGVAGYLTVPAVKATKTRDAAPANNVNVYELSLHLNPSTTMPVPFTLKVAGKTEDNEIVNIVEQSVLPPVDPTIPADSTQTTPPDSTQIPSDTTKIPDPVIPSDSTQIPQDTTKIPDPVIPTDSTQNPDPVIPSDSTQTPGPATPPDSLPNWGDSTRFARAFLFMR